MAQVKEILPMLPEALSLFLADKKNAQAAETLANVAKAAVTVPTKVTKPLANGAQKS